MSPKRHNRNTPQTPTAFRFMSSIVMIVIGILVFITLSAFFYTGGTDRSIFDLSFYEILTDTELEVQNPMGKFGAWFSDMVITNGIGLSAFTIPWLLVACGLYLLGVRSFSLKNQILYCFGIAIWGSVAFGFIFSKFAGNIYPLLGGAYGYVCAKWFVSSIGMLGTAALLFLTLFSYIATKAESVRRKVSSFLLRLRIPIPTLSVSDDEGELIDVDPSKDPTILGHWTNTIGEKEPTEGNEELEASTDTSSGSCMPNPNGEKEIAGRNEADKTLGGNDDLGFSYSKAQEEETIETADTKEGNDTSPIPELTITNAVGESTVNRIHHSIDEDYDPTLDLEHYEFPDIHLLNSYDNQEIQLSTEELEKNKNRIVETLNNFQISISTITATVGPTVTLYEIVTAPGIRISKVQSLEQDIAMSLSALGIRIIAPIPGRGTIGIEVPNSKPKIVSMRSVIQSVKFQKSAAELPVAIGKTISNETFVFDLAKTPHLLVAGATGQGKSVGLNAIIASILYRKHPSQVKFVLVDPKMVEFSIYKVLEKHFLAKMGTEGDAIITDIDKVKGTLQSLTIEMDTRYKLLERANVRGIKEYNEKFVKRTLNPENGHRYLPYIIVIIDEFADLIMQCGKEVEMPIARIAQKARAVGIHMILATQRPSTNIITGVIKANFPSRIAFKVASMVDSRTILDASGAQNLIGRGDMLIHMTSEMSAKRVQCAFLDTPEVEHIVSHISSQQGYATAYELPECVVNDKGQVEESGMTLGKFDDKIKEVARMVVNSQIGSTSNIQRQFEVGFNRAGKIMDQLERLGIVSAVEGSKPRKVFVSTEAELENIFRNFGIE